MLRTEIRHHAGRDQLGRPPARDRPRLPAGLPCHGGPAALAWVRHGQAAPRVHRRRLHRRDRSRQHAGAGGHADAPDHRRAGPGLGRRRGRRAGRRPEVAHRPGGRGRRRLAPGAGLAPRAGDRALLLQVLLDVRLDGPGQHRPGRRRPARRARRAAHDLLPGVSDQRPHRLPGPSLRRRTAPVGLADASPPPHADDRREPGSGPRPPDAADGGAGAVPRGRPGGARHRDGARAARRARRDARGGRRRQRRRPHGHRDGRARAAPRDGGLRPRDGAAGKLHPRRSAVRRHPGRRHAAHRRSRDGRWR